MAGRPNPLPCMALRPVRSPSMQTSEGPNHMTTKTPRGRHFFANPGPTNIPDSVLRALDRPTIDFHDPDFRKVYMTASMA